MHLQKVQVLTIEVVVGAREALQGTALALVLGFLLIQGQLSLTLEFQSLSQTGYHLIASVPLQLSPLPRYQELHLDNPLAPRLLKQERASSLQGIVRVTTEAEV